MEEINLIITIDDNEDLNKLTCQLLSLMGCEILAASNGQEGIEKARLNKAKVILCDIGMPQMNGYEVAEHIRKDKELKDTYLIAISGYSRPENIEKSIDSGFDEHLSKPINYEDLKEKLNAIYSGTISSNYNKL